MSKTDMESKRLCEYILAQEPLLTEYSLMTGKFRFDGSCVGDAFSRAGHSAYEELKREFYLKPVDNISTFEWQHATANYKKVLSCGISGIIDDIHASKLVHTNEEEIAFLEAIERVANALIGWARKCSERARSFADDVSDDRYRENLLRLSAALLRVLEKAPIDFYEAVLTIYVCFSADPDSLGTLDRMLRTFYEKGLADGTLTREEAKEYLQELFLMVQATTQK